MGAEGASCQLGADDARRDAARRVLRRGGRQRAARSTGGAETIARGGGRGGERRHDAPHDPKHPTLLPWGLLTKVSCPNPSLKYEYKGPPHRSSRGPAKMLTVRRVATRALSLARPAAARAPHAARALSGISRGFEGAARPAPALFAKLPAPQVRRGPKHAWARGARGAGARGGCRAARGARARFAAITRVHVWPRALGSRLPCSRAARLPLRGARAGRMGCIIVPWRRARAERAMWTRGLLQQRPTTIHQRQRASVGLAPAAMRGASICRRLRRVASRSRARVPWPDSWAFGYVRSRGCLARLLPPKKRGRSLWATLRGE